MLFVLQSLLILFLLKLLKSLFKFSQTRWLLLAFNMATWFLFNPQFGTSLDQTLIRTCSWSAIWLLLLRHFSNCSSLVGCCNWCISVLELDKRQWLSKPSCCWNSHSLRAQLEHSLIISWLLWIKLHYLLWQLLLHITQLFLVLNLLIFHFLLIFIHGVVLEQLNHSIFNNSLHLGRYLLINEVL